MTKVTWAFAILLSAAALSAQPRPAYEVASVKPNNSGTGDSSTDGSKGQIVFVNQTLKRLIERAYNVRPFQVTGPAWLETDHFDIAAKYPPDTKPDERILMLRTLLEDRFKLAVHRETKEGSGYALVVAKGGFKLKPVAPGKSGTHDSSSNRVHTLTAEAISMGRLAEQIARSLGETVIDKTGIEGVYNLELRWTTDDQSDTVPSLFIALQETLGLRLQPQKVPIEIIAVDHIERTPVEN